jgi:hypothetical protein
MKPMKRKARRQLVEDQVLAILSLAGGDFIVTWASIFAIVLD